MRDIYRVLLFFYGYLISRDVEDRRHCCKKRILFDIQNSIGHQ